MLRQIPQWPSLHAAQIHSYRRATSADPVRDTLCASARHVPPWRRCRSAIPVQVNVRLDAATLPAPLVASACIVNLNHRPNICFVKIDRPAGTSRWPILSWPDGHFDSRSGLSCLSADPPRPRRTGNVVRRTDQCWRFGRTGPISMTGAASLAFPTASVATTLTEVVP